ncbi:MAG: PKD domain-containing protein [Bacteroidia bacterium]|nr:PKD domain-containing protein [Bacteroidia bacterium]
MQLKQLVLALVLFAFLLPENAHAQLTADFSANNTRGCSPFSLVAQFQNLSTGNPSSYLWRFGDAANTTSTLATPTFVYQDPGCYDVTLVVTDAGGAQDSITRSCFIEILPAPVVDFTVSQTEGCVPLDICFTDNSTSAGGAIVDWEWTLSDGQPGVGANPCFNFTAAPDTIGVILRVTDANGCSSTQIFQDVIELAEPPVLDFDVDVNSSCNPPLTVNFLNNTQLNGGVNPTYTWNFPGGTTNTGASTATGQTPPPVTYNADGQYDAQLIVSTSNGCADTLIRNAIVGIGGVTASFTNSATIICLGDTITFESTSMGGVSDLAWNFGETAGVNSTDQIVQYVYSTPGTYTVTLQANNPVCGDTIIQVDLITVNQSPTASFTVDRMEDCQPGIPFNFTDGSSPDVTTWTWDFGDGNTSNQQNPNHTYTAFGTYVVCLTVENGLSCPDVFCDTLTVAPPNVNFQRSISEGCAPLTVDFTDISTSIDPIVSWEWDFGSATNAVPPTSTDQNPAGVQFTATGNYTVQLIITTVNGCTDTLNFVNAIMAGDAPIVDFTVDKDTICINEDITFRSLNTDPDWEYFWDFQYVDPGNFVMLDDTATTVYPDSGTFDVALVINDNGCRDTLVQEDLVFVSPPKAQFALSDSVVCTVPSTIQIADSSIGPADIYTWFLNGALYSNLQDPPPLTVTTPGAYVLTQAIENSLTGCTDTFSAVIFAGDPVADFTLDVNDGCRPLTVTPTPNVQNVNGLLWFFDYDTGGGVVPGSAPQFTYADTGLYSVALIVTDAFGCADTMIRTDDVTVYGTYPVIDIDPGLGCPPLDVDFTENTAVFSLSTPTLYTWDFGDGNTSNQQNPTHTYVNRGLFDITLAVTEDHGCVDSVTIPGGVVVTQPIPDFSVVDSSTCAGAMVQFTNTTGGVNPTYVWDFGDGNTSTDPDPTHVYADTGFYDVTLTATDQNGCSATITRTNAVYIESFAADFTAVDTLAFCPILTTQFTDASSGNVNGWRWTFGDGFGFSTLQNPQHVYFLAGDFDVTLIATHEDGCQDTTTKNNFIQIGGPLAQFSIDKTEVCLGDTVEITVITQGAIGIVPVSWQDGGADFINNLPGGFDTTVVSHVYLNSGVFYPTVSVIDGTCQVDLPAQDSVIVHAPPTAALSPVDTLGCAPLNINYTDLSTEGDTAIASWQWSFGNGDSSTLQNPPYTYLVNGNYDVDLVVTDFFGCVDSVSTTTSVLPGVIADFTTPDTLGCAPAAVTFTDLSTFGPPTSYVWAFGDGDTLFGNPNPTHIYQNDGVYDVTLIVSDGLGCEDTLTKPAYIRLQHPDAVVYSDISQGCNPLTVTFFADSSSSTFPITQYEWCLVEINTGQIVCATTPAGRDSLEIPFSEPGNYIMTVAITDSLGCADTSAAVTIDVDTRIVPQPVVLENVTVVDDNTVDITWLPYAGNDFVAYEVHRINGPLAGPIATITDQNTTNFTETNPLLDVRNGSFCYKILVQNTCLEFSDIDATQEHCTVDLETTPLVDAIQLDWSSYVGYIVGQYEIYRAINYDPNTLVLVDVVAGNTLTYTDTAQFCRDSVTYRVLAIGFGNTNQRSFSDLSEEAPIHPQPTESSDIITATVVDDDYIDISWNTYLGTQPGDYVFQRSTDGTNYTTIDTLPFGTTTYQDTSVLVDEQSYYYRIFNIDQCGDLSADGLFGRSILLGVSFAANGTTPVLNWNNYQNWAGGVLNYEIQIFNTVNGVFETVGIVPGNQTTFEDDLSDLNQAEYCYRIVAYESGGNGATSTSNEDCVIFAPKVYVPSAFTPNNDGNNDVFRAFVPNLGNGEMLIYDRWGELLYRTLDPNNEGWDGTFKGQAVQEGVYVFLISGQGVDGTDFRRSGTVTLFR